MTLPVKQRPTSVTCLAAETELGAWDVRDATILSVTLRNTGAEDFTPTIKARIDPSEPMGPSPLTFSTVSGDGVVRPGESARVDIDCGANLEVGVYGQAAVVSTTVVVTARPDEGTR